MLDVVGTLDVVVLLAALLVLRCWGARAAYEEASNK
jgi:hypothetical protein